MEVFCLGQRNGYWREGARRVMRIRVEKDWRVNLGVASASERWRMKVKWIWQRTFGAAAVLPGGLRSEPRFAAVEGAVSSSGGKHQ